MTNRATTYEGTWGKPRYFEASDGVVLVAIPHDEGERGVCEIHCHGPNDHFRDPDGGCEHTDLVLSVQTGARMPIRVVGYRGYGARDAMEA